MCVACSPHMHGVLSQGGEKKQKKVLRHRISIRTPEPEPRDGTGRVPSTFFSFLVFLRWKQKQRYLSISESFRSQMAGFFTSALRLYFPMSHFVVCPLLLLLLHYSRSSPKSLQHVPSAPIVDSGHHASFFTGR